jgi:hypothetical protein
MSEKEIKDFKTKIKKLEKLVEIQNEAIVVADYCLSDYVIRNGVKFVNQKDLTDAQDILKETLAKTRKRIELYIK